MKRCKIFIVEDEPLIRLDLLGALEDSGHEVVGHASRFDEALMLAKSIDCDVALLDINIEGHRVDPVADVLITRGAQIIFITGYRVDDVAPRHRHLPCIEKPFDLRALNAIVDKECSRSMSAECEPAAG